MKTPPPTTSDLSPTAPNPPFDAAQIKERLAAASAALAEKYPPHLRPSARQMAGWPTIVSPHLDHLPEFQRITAGLEVGAERSAS